MNGIFNEDTQRKGIKILGTHKGKGLRFWGHTKEDERLNEIFNEDTQRKTEGEGIKILWTHKGRRKVE